MTLGTPIPLVQLDADIVIVGGGAAGCMAAVAAREHDPSCRVVIVEKANIERSGCLAAGINALHGCPFPGETPEDYLAHIEKEAHGLVRRDLVLSIAPELEGLLAPLANWGLPIDRTADGQPERWGRRSIRIHGESIKPLLARAASRSGAQVINRVVTTNFLRFGGRVRGVFGFGLRDGAFYLVQADTVICATGGAAGIYPPTNTGEARGRTWYPQFNAGSGLAMGIRAGAELTSLEMRFVALRVKGGLAPTGTLAQGFRTPQINRLGEEYLAQHQARTTCQRLWATLAEERRGNGPCYLDTRVLTPRQTRELREAYLHMCPSMLLFWADQGQAIEDTPLEVMGTEPHIVGGHGMAGYWIDQARRTTLPGLYAAGDVAGGALKKYLLGALAEGRIAGRDAVRQVSEKPRSAATIPGTVAGLPRLVETERERVFRPLLTPGYLEPRELEARLHEIMDRHAGGRSTGYGTNRHDLLQARHGLRGLNDLVPELQARDTHELMLAHQAIDRLDLARMTVEHLLYREESRWPPYQLRHDHPQPDDRDWLRFVNSVFVPGTGEVSVFWRGDPSRSADLLGVGGERDARSG